MVKKNPNNGRSKYKTRAFKPPTISKQVSPVNGATMVELKQCEHNTGLDGKRFKSG